MTLKHPEAPGERTNDLAVAPLFGLETLTIPRHEPAEGELPPDVAYQIIHDELMLDGNARMNVATFVTTWMEPWHAPDAGESTGCSTTGSPVPVHDRSTATTFHH